MKYPWRLKHRIRGNNDDGSVLSPIDLSEYASLPASKLITTGALATTVVVKCIRSEAVRRAVYFWRVAGPMIGHYKWTQFWLGISGAERHHREFVYEQLHNKYAEPALQLVMHLKGLYCKIGQVLSARPDFLPAQYCTRFSKVQDNIPPWPVKKVEEIIESSLQSKLGYDFKEVFKSIDAIAV
jgi:predicted unusual protein kinase regulating ubiquinone biosynthesis (AarF/ABC1/UbiB family)